MNLDFKKVKEKGSVGKCFIFIFLILFPMNGYINYWEPAGGWKVNRLYLKKPRVMNRYEMEKPIEIEDEPTWRCLQGILS